MVAVDKVSVVSKEFPLRAMRLGLLGWISGPQVTLFLEVAVTRVFAELSLIPPSSSTGARFAALLRAFLGSVWCFRLLLLILLLMEDSLEELLDPRDPLDPLECTLGASIRPSRNSSGGSDVFSENLLIESSGGASNS